MRGIRFSKGLTVFLLAAVVVSSAYPAAGQEFTQQQQASIQQAAELLDGDDIPAAYRLVKPLLTAFPESPVVNYLMGTALHKANNGVLATKFLIKALKGTLTPTEQEMWRGMREDTFKQLFDVYAGSLALDRAERMIEMGEREFGKEAFRPLREAFVPLKTTFEQIITYDTLKFSNQVCSVVFRLPKGWFCFQNQTDLNKFECRHTKFLPDHSFENRLIMLQTIPYPPEIATEEDRRNLLSYTTNSYAEEMGHIGMKPTITDLTVGGFPAVSMITFSKVGFMKVTAMTIFVDLPGGLLQIVIPHRKKSIVEKAGKYLLKVLKLKSSR